MGLILDSTVVIAAERRGDTVEKLIEQVVAVAVKMGVITRLWESVVPAPVLQD
jgi:hypothetical protein